MMFTLRKKKVALQIESWAEQNLWIWWRSCHHGEETRKGVWFNPVVTHKRTNRQACGQKQAMEPRELKQEKKTGIGYWYEAINGISGASLYVTLPVMMVVACWSLHFGRKVVVWLQNINKQHHGSPNDCDQYIISPNHWSWTDAWLHWNIQGQTMTIFEH